MIHKAAVLGFLLGAMALIVIGAVSYRSEVVCWGRDRWKGGSRDGDHDFTFKPGQLATGSRAGFQNGAFVHVSTYTPVGWVTVSGRHVNGIVFQWRRSVDRFLVTDAPYLDIRIESPRIVTERFILPLWGPLVLLLMLPVVSFFRGPYRRYRRRKRGLCLACGYNLSGNTSGTCPECGCPCNGVRSTVLRQN